MQSNLDAKALSARTITASTGLTGGGNLTADRSIALNSTTIASLARADIAVQGYSNTTPDSAIKIELMTAAQYAAATKDSKTIYIVT